MDKLTLFDVNCFVGRSAAPQPGAYQDANGLLRVMDDCGIAEALVTNPLAVSYDPSTDNDLAKHPRLHACPVVMPDHIMIEPGIRAVRILPKRIGPLRSWSCGRLFAELWPPVRGAGSSFRPNVRGLRTGALSRAHAEHRLGRN